jgi:thiamine pyrophosphate-dependent acetolactate synthase large subunit-like protein
MTEYRLYDALAAAFAAEGVDTHFTLLGDGNMHWATVLAEKYGVRTIHARHEHSAVAMASAFAHVTGRVGLASVSRGPGLTQIMTALTTAARGEIPLVVFAGEAPTSPAWSIQHIDQAPFVRACGVEYLQIQSVNHALDRLREAFCIAGCEHRPVVLAASDDLQRSPARSEVRYVPSREYIPAQRLCPPDEETVRNFAEMIAAAKRPIILAGRGVWKSGARKEVTELAERRGALIATTLLARGLFDDDPYGIGIAGGWSSDLALELFSECDLVIAVGASLSGYTTHSGRLYPHAHVIRIDSEVRAVRHHRALAQAHLVADAREGVAAINAILARSTAPKNGFRTKAIAERIRESRKPLEQAVAPGTIDPRTALREIDRVVPKDWFIVGGSGHCAYFTATEIRNRPPDLFASIRDFGAIGSNLAHAIGIAVARNSRKILLIDGDGSLLMHIQELETIARHRLQMLIVALNDGAYGSEVHKLRMDGFCDGEVKFGRPDFAAIARGFGLRGSAVKEIGQIEALFRTHLANDQTEIWDVPISGEVVSLPFIREAREKTNERTTP